MIWELGIPTIYGNKAGEKSVKRVPKEKCLISSSDLV
jgi:hypothetical protein